MTAMMKGDPRWKGVLKQSAKQMAAKVLPKLDRGS